MKFDSARRKFLKAGIVLPAAGLVSAHSLNAFSDTAGDAGYRRLGITSRVCLIKCRVYVAVIVHPVLSGARTEWMCRTD
jgi:hypothetical protein